MKLFDENNFYAKLDIPAIYVDKTFEVLSKLSLIFFFKHLIQEETSKAKEVAVEAGEEKKEEVVAEKIEEAASTASAEPAAAAAEVAVEPAKA